MICVTDRTLSCVDGLPDDKPPLSRFLELLIKTDPGAIELSERVYQLLSPLPEYPRYVMRIERAADAAKYPRVGEFVCRGAPPDADERVCVEILLNNTRKATLDTVAAYARRPKVRVWGMDGAMCGDYRRMFARLAESFKGVVEFCPSNRLCCATALAAEWATGGTGKNVVAAFGGAGDFAPTEEVLMALRVNNLLDDAKPYDSFPEMASLFGKITGKKVKANKPVIGKQIFHVESSVHVDGILKQPRCYEPFPPETVGQERKIVLGKQSGAASIRAKLSEHGMERAEEDIPLILDRVKAKAAEKRGAVSDRDFARIVRELA